MKLTLKFTEPDMMIVRHAALNRRIDYEDSDALAEMLAEMCREETDRKLDQLNGQSAEGEEGKT